ncbi:hypothetical protein EJB05_11000, partial [Eragrostis curvula]
MPVTVTMDGPEPLRLPVMSPQSGVLDAEKNGLTPLFKEMIRAVINVGVNPFGAKLPEPPLGLSMEGEKWKKAADFGAGGVLEEDRAAAGPERKKKSPTTTAPLPPPPPAAGVRSRVARPAGVRSRRRPSRRRPLASSLVPPASARVVACPAPSRIRPPHGSGPPRRRGAWRPPPSSWRAAWSAPPPPPAAWGILRLGVVSAPEVYPPRPAELPKNAAAAVARGGGGGSRSARFERVSAAVEKKLGLGGLLGDSLGCKCSPDAIEPVHLPVVAAKKKVQGGKKDGVKSGGVRRSRILDWFEEFSIAKEKK